MIFFKTTHGNQIQLRFHEKAAGSILHVALTVGASQCVLTSI